MNQDDELAALKSIYEPVPIGAYAHARARAPIPLHSLEEEEEDDGYSHIFSDDDSTPTVSNSQKPQPHISAVAAEAQEQMQMQMQIRMRNNLPPPMVVPQILSIQTPSEAPAEGSQGQIRYSEFLNPAKPASPRHLQPQSPAQARGQGQTNDFAFASSSGMTDQAFARVPVVSNDSLTSMHLNNLNHRSHLGFPNILQGLPNATFAHLPSRPLATNHLQQQPQQLLMLPHSSPMMSESAMPLAAALSFQSQDLASSMSTSTLHGDQSQTASPLPIISRQQPVPSLIPLRGLPSSISSSATLPASHSSFFAGRSLSGNKRRKVADHGPSVALKDCEPGQQRILPHKKNPQVSRHNDQWTMRCDELRGYRSRYGNTLVPHNWSESPPLAQWVKRQRYQYKLKHEGKHSNLTDERERELESLGFVWDSHAVAWEEKWNLLLDFKAKNGHANVPITYNENPQLAVWVKCQRRQYKLMTEGKTKSTMTTERILRLESIGFVWFPREV